MTDDLETHFRRARTRRRRALWWARSVPYRVRREARTFLRRDGNWIFVLIVAAFGATMVVVYDAKWWSQAFGCLAGIYVLWVLDRSRRKVETARFLEREARRRATEACADLQASIPVLVTNLVEEQMHGLGYRRRAQLLVGDVAYDAETGDPIDMRKPEQMWEKI